MRSQTISDICLSCAMRKGQYFCDLSDRALHYLNAVKSTAVYPKRAQLFIEGEAAYGVFLLCTGRVKLSTCSHEGKTIITKISQPGDVLGLNAVVSNRPYEVTAEMMDRGRASFIPRDSLLQFMREHGEVAQAVAEQLCSNYYAAHEVIQTLGLAVSERVSKFLPSHNSGSSRITLTQEEIAESIGTTRNTVTRLFSEFKKRQLTAVKGSTQSPSVCE